MWFWLWVPTITRDAGGLGAPRRLQHLVAVHQVAVILISCLCIHDGNVWNDGNWGRKEKGINLFSGEQGLAEIVLETYLSLTYWTEVWRAERPG